MSVVYTYLYTKSSCFSPKSQWAYTETVDFMQKFLFKLEQYLGLIYIRKPSHELLLCKFCNLVLCCADTDSQCIRRAALALCIIDCIENAFPYTVKVSVSFKF